MTRPSDRDGKRRPHLEPARVYRTRDLAARGANASRLAQRLVREGSLVRIARGLFVHPERSHFGAVPPTDEELGAPSSATRRSSSRAPIAGTRLASARPPCSRPLSCTTRGARACSNSADGGSCFVGSPFLRARLPSVSSSISWNMPSRPAPPDPRSQPGFEGAWRGAPSTTLACARGRASTRRR